MSCHVLKIFHYVLNEILLYFEFYSLLEVKQNKYKKAISVLVSSGQGPSRKKKEN